MEGIREIVKIAIQIGDLKHLQNIDIITSDRREKIEALIQDVEDLYNAFAATKSEQHQEDYVELAFCYHRLCRIIRNDNFDLRIFSRFRNDPIDDLEKFHNSVMTLETDTDSLLFHDRASYLRLGNLIIYSSQPSDDNKILRVRSIRGVKGGFNAIVTNKNDEEMKLNKYQLSCCHRIISHSFSCDDEAMQKLDRGCLLERLLDITMSKFF